jgi:hypothetical protein
VLPFTTNATSSKVAGTPGSAGSRKLRAPGVPPWRVRNDQLAGSSLASPGCRLARIATDAAVNPGGFGYPGGSGAGTANGFTQRGGGGDWSIAYGVRNIFVVQTDFVQLSDRVDITVGATPGNIFGSGNISIFFRETGHALGEIGIFNGASETITGLTTGIPGNNAWQNYALLVNIPNDTIEVFVNEVSRGTIDLATIGGGAYAGILNNAFVGVGGAGDDRLWSDNFQVGAPIPEPSAIVLLGLAGLIGFRRRR